MSVDKTGILQALNPSDYFTLAMDEEIRNENMAGSLCGFALELDSCPNIALLEARINELKQRFPIILASLQQRGNRFYWCQREKEEPIFFQTTCPENTDVEFFIKNQLETLINQQQSREDIAPLSFHLITTETNCVFLLRWLHPLCDAVGANLILQYLCTDEVEKRLAFDTPASEPLLPLRLRKFNLWKKIKLFMKAKRYIQGLDEQKSIIHAADKAPEKLRLASYRLSVAQTAKINKIARKQVGLTGASLYYIGCFMRALERMNPEQEGEAYCVPYAFNLRKQKALTPLLGNHVGALFAQAPRNLLANREQLFAHLKQQNMNVIRQQLDYAFLPVMWAASYLPLKKHGENLRLSYKHKTERSSFWFSHVSLPELAKQSICDAEITGFLHLCQVSSPPAIALLSCEYQQQLTLSYNYVEPLFSREWVERLHELMVQELLDEVVEPVAFS
ncbi:MAG: hypothetical protein GQ569_13570 [Methylococcaceae bacterium]|nr:hypothetical protein [Methylococcaceae bacterium]